MPDSPETPIPDLEDENRKLRAEVRALIHQRDELQQELIRHRVFVRLCAAVFPAVEGLKPQHAAEKARPLATVPVILTPPTATPAP